MRQPVGPAERADSRTQTAAQPVPWVLQSGPDTLVLVHARPDAKITGLMGVHAGRLKIAVAAPPVDGKANSLLLDLLAALLRVPRRRVQIQSGAAGREKSVRIEASDANAIASIIAAQLATHN